MLQPLSLRSVNRRARREQEMMARWRERGLPVAYERIPPFAHYIAFRALDQQTSWRGLIDLDEWLSRAIPALSGLASSCRTREQVLKLFAVTAAPFAPPQQELAYDRLEIEGLIDGKDVAVEEVPCLNSDCGRLWLLAMPEMQLADLDPAASWLADFSLCTHFEIGRSRISAGLLSQAVEGDALLATHAVPRISVGGVTLGHYVWNEKGMVVSNFEEQKTDAADVMENIGTSSEAPGSCAQLLAQVPVQLAFVLERKYLSIKELSCMLVGQLIELPPGVEQRILITANGVPLGSGELLQLDGCLGVELKELYGRGRNVK